MVGLKSSPPHPVVLGEKKADLGQTKASPRRQRVLGDRGGAQGCLEGVCPPSPNTEGFPSPLAPGQVWLLSPLMPSHL